METYKELSCSPNRNIMLILENMHQMQTNGRGNESLVLTGAAESSRFGRNHPSESRAVCVCVCVILKPELRLTATWRLAMDETQIPIPF